MQEQAQRFGWLPWRRPSRRPPSADTPSAVPPQRRGWLQLGRKPAHSSGEAGSSDEVLDFAREWLLALGGRLLATDGDVLAGTLHDGTDVRYTRSAARARREPNAELLAPGTPAFDALLADVTRRGTALFLRAPAVDRLPEALAREAFASPAPTCPACVASDPDAAHHAVSPECPLNAGRFVVLGASKGVRDAAIERRWEPLTAEHTFWMAITAPQGRHEEVVRIAVDAATGEPRQPLSTAILRRASAAPQDAAQADVADVIRQTQSWAEARLEPAALAAARLARLRNLAEFQRRQEHITGTYAQLLVETPDLAQDLLSARERELARLSEAYAIELETRPVNAAVIATPMAHVRVRFAGGGEAELDVDLACGTVAQPRCVTCGSAWRLGARCAEGHVTCLACQQVCAHCGMRRCARCAAAPMQECPTCSAMTCASCAKATARGRHRVQAITAVAPAPALPAVESTAHRAVPTAAPDAWDLTVADLDAMTPVSWQSAVAWLLECLGHTVERTLESDETVLAVACRPSEQAGSNARAGELESRGTMLALAHRPDEGFRTGDDLFARVGALAAELPTTRGLVVTTVPAAALPERRPQGMELEIVDRAGLERLLAIQASAYLRARASADSETDARARAASAVRAGLLTGTTAAADLLLGAVGGPTSHDGAEAAGSLDREQLPARLERVIAQALVVRRALAAIETLLAEWEATFAQAPTRDGTLAISADVATLESQKDRAGHLTAALHEVCTALIATPASGGRHLDEWFGSVLDELAHHCRSLAARCAALDPTEWRSFDRVRDDDAVRASAEALAASKRSAMRARRLRDEIDALVDGTVESHAHTSGS